MHPGVTEETFADLHKGLAEYFMKALTAKDTPHQIIKEAREFLKDNHIEGIKKSGNHLDRLSAFLPPPSSGDEETEIPLRLVATR